MGAARKPLSAPPGLAQLGASGRATETVEHDHAVRAINEIVAMDGSAGAAEEEPAAQVGARAANLPWLAGMP